MSSLRSSVTVGLFVVGLAAGGAVFGALHPPAPSTPYPTIPGAPEPPVTANLAKEIAADDSHALAQTLESDMLSKLADALDPLVEVRDVKFVGAVAKEKDTLAAYLARGMDNSGMTWIVGFVLRVQGNSVVGVN